MTFFACKNLVSQSFAPCVPWEFVISTPIPAQIRKVKSDRQAWYNNTATEHQFYTGIEPANPNMRVGKENPPRKIHAFCADYDAPISDERAAEAIASMKIKPAWTERSLGGNLRLIWTLPAPLVVDDYSFCSYLLEAAKKWLNLDLLPALDESAFTTPSRLLCNGGVWKATGHGPIRDIDLQSFFVSAGQKFNFNSSATTEIPLSIVSAEIAKRYPGFTWPGDFVLDSQGPTFWITESTSPLSAIVKTGGMFSFSANAAKPFYPWSDILGADFVKDYVSTSITKATQNLWWDGKRAWRLIKDQYESMGGAETENFLTVNCGLSKKKGGESGSPIDLALNHIYSENRIKAAVPFVFKPQGPIYFQGLRMLNTYNRKALTPASGAQEWGPAGNFPFISYWLDNLFNPAEQLPHFLAWLKHYYSAAFYMDPNPGQNIFILGGVGIGKTLLNRFVIGGLVGGYIDASNFLVDGENFNSHLFHTPHWCLDDDSPTGSNAAMNRLHALFKKLAANQQFVYNEKFQVSGMTEWAGRIGTTANLDFSSTRVIGPMDNSSRDKTCIFRCVEESVFKFPSRAEVREIIARELPFFGRYLLDWIVPDAVERDSRFGYISHHEPTLLTQSHHTNPAAPFKEVLIDVLGTHFAANPEQTEWRGTVSTLLKLMNADGSNDIVLRSIKVDQANRYLENISKEGLLKCRTDTNSMNMRIWIFDNPNPSPEIVKTPTAVAHYSPTT